MLEKRSRGSHNGPILSALILPKEMIQFITYDSEGALNTVPDSIGLEG
jgi:hypothetical protein